MATTPPDDQRSRIDVVIPVRDRWDLTSHCLELLRAQTAQHTTIVVDNGSTDDTPARIRTEFPEVTVLELGANMGFAAACNRGVEVGDADVVVLLNNDVEAPADFLEQLARPFESDERVGMVAAVLLRPGRETIDSVGLTADVTLAGFPRLRGNPVRAARDPRPVLSGPCGAAGAYRRSAWTEVCGLDEGVLFYGEDLDLALRMRSAGWGAVVADEAVAVHLGSASFGARSAWQRYQGGFARGYFARRYDLLTGAAPARVALTELAVVAGDAVLSRDISALRGRIAGWRSARDAGKRPFPPADAYDQGIGWRDSFRLRRQVYAT